MRRVSNGLGREGCSRLIAFIRNKPIVAQEVGNFGRERLIAHGQTAKVSKLSQARRRLKAQERVTMPLPKRLVNSCPNVPPADALARRLSG